jgi:hypothetical protein
MRRNKIPELAAGKQTVGKKRFWAPEEQMPAEAALGNFMDRQSRLCFPHIIYCT